MIAKHTLAAVLILTCTFNVRAADEVKSEPAELAVLKESIGVWDAEIEVWPQGPKAKSIKFKGVETNRAYGKHWLASDFVSTFMGQKMKLHSIVGYDLDKKKLVGTVIDHGPYSASMTGEYNAKTNSVTWMTKAKTIQGKPMIQKTVLTQKSPNVRILVLKVPGAKQGEFNTYMQIKFTKRK